MTLSDRINQFIEKQLKFRTAEEARSYGIKLPSEAEFKPLHPEYREKPKKLPKIQKPTKTPKETKVPKKPKRFEPKVSGVVEEVAHQLTPKGRYESPEQISADIREAERLARRITGIKKKEG